MLIVMVSRNNLRSRRSRASSEKRESQHCSRGLAQEFSGSPLEEPSSWGPLTLQRLPWNGSRSLIPLEV